MQHRILVLAQEVDDEIGRRLTSQLLQLAAEDPRADITLLINSPGGAVSAGLGIFDTLQMIGNDVVTLATGLAASMGQFLLSAGTPGKRYAQPDRKSTRLNSSHVKISYAVFCLKKNNALDR